MGTIHQAASSAQCVANLEQASEARRVAIETACDLAADGDTRASWHWPWVLVRRLRTVPGIDRETDPLSLVIQSAVVAAHEVLADAAMDHEYPDAGDLVAAVVAIWDRVIYADGEGPLELAVRRAAAMPVMPQPSIGAKYTRLMSIAYHLQEIQGTEPILLPTRRLDAVLGVSAAQVGRLLQAGVSLRHLEVVDPHYGPSRCRRYRCHIRSARPAPRR